MDISTELQALSDKWKGKRILISSKSSHPHAGETCEILGFENTNAGTGMKVKGEDQEFFVFNSCSFIFLTNC